MKTMKTHLAFFFFLSCVFASQEASAPVLVENEPLHHVVLKNESVVVLHLTLPAGERTLMTEWPSTFPVLRSHSRRWAKRKGHLQRRNPEILPSTRLPEILSHIES